eukprot:CAMPEP_0181480050 /NCGR_PEP_ID=MMETSP1110-20121109/43600_1 /TAXON_ID=174948 /ORGANISM="Symbiodinium sp., Strain CCMP421" /LENGTH=95 /DNA_ID=CAMNT_0023605507 /DNA_START=94 /DNA_END=381 /DNA_ORIENTATION=-
MFPNRGSQAVKMLHLAALQASNDMASSHAPISVNRTQSAECRVALPDLESSRRIQHGHLAVNWRDIEDNRCSTSKFWMYIASKHDKIAGCKVFRI